MTTFAKSLKLFISALLLFSLIVSFNEVTSAVIKRQGSDFCKGFAFTSPKEGDKVKNNAEITVSWTNGGSKVVEATDIELFNDKGGLAVLWTGNKSFGSDGTASQDTKITAPSDLKLPAEVMLRSWGSTDNGPDCFVLSPKFTLEKEN